MIKKKYNILLVVTDFCQAGCEKYNYEMDKWLDRSQFETEILCYHPLGIYPEWEDYYYPLHKELGTEVKFLEDFKKPFGRIRRKISLDVEGLKKYFDSFDFVLFQGEYCWRGFAKFLDYDEKRYYVTIHNSLVQQKNNYEGFTNEIKYNFISSFTNDQAKFEFKQFKDYDFYNFPLSISAKWKQEWKPSFINSKRISTFTRLSKGKSIIPFLYSFQIILNDIPDAELLIFGTGDPEEVGVNEHIRLLNLENNVKFMGHSKNIVQSAIDHEVSVVFFHGYHHVPGGFASFQLSSAGIPQLFFEMIPQDIIERDVVLYSTNSIYKLAKKTLGFLRAPDKLKKLSEEQLKKIKEERNIEETIIGLQYYLINRF